MGNLSKNIQLMLDFLKAPFLILQFSLYTADDTTLVLQCEQAFDFWEQLGGGIWT